MIDDCRFSAESTLHYVRIDGSLRKEVNLSDFLSFFLEYTDEFLTDDFTLALRLCDACKLAVVAFLCVDADKVDVERTAFAEYALYLISLVLAEKSVVYNTQVSCLPIALARSAASTDESTPPESARSTLPSPTFSLISSIVFLTNESIFHVPAHPHTPRTKL